jgi:hypothetical protein
VRYPSALVLFHGGLLTVDLISGLVLEPLAANRQVLAMAITSAMVHEFPGPGELSARWRKRRRR